MILFCCRAGANPWLCAKPATASPACLLVVELGGPTMMARIGIIEGVEPPHRTRVRSVAERQHWGKRKLKRDE
jgi:hypothetical protein